MFLSMFLVNNSVHMPVGSMDLATHRLASYMYSRMTYLSGFPQALQQ